MFGVSYKKNINDVRESPAIYIIEEIIDSGGKVIYYDPFVSEIYINGMTLKSEKNYEDVLKQSDCVVFITDHDDFKEMDFSTIKKFMKNPAVVDCRNVLNTDVREDIIYFCIGRGEDIY